MKKLSLFVLMMATMFVASAQMLNPAKVSCSVKETSATEAELIVTVKLDDGWHMYSQHTDPNGPIATTFEFTKSKDYALVGKVNEPKPHEENDPLFGCVVKSFEGIVVFKQKIKRLSQNDFTVKGMISFQLCNNGSCIPPEDHDIVFKVKGATETQATGDSHERRPADQHRRGCRHGDCRQRRCYCRQHDGRHRNESCSSKQ